MTTGLWELQTAAYVKLAGDATLMGFISGVFDEVPEKTAMPYVTFGEVEEVPDDGHDRQGLETTLTLHIWSRYRGYEEAARILRELDRLLDRAPLTVDGFEHVSIAHTSHQFMRDPDLEVRHAVVTYRVWMTEPVIEEV